MGSAPQSAPALPWSPESAASSPWAGAHPRCCGGCCGGARAGCVQSGLLAVLDLKKFDALNKAAS